MKNSNLSTNRERREAERRIWRIALAASVGFHLLLVLLWQADSVLVSPFAAAGPRAADVRPAGGSMEAIALTTPPVEPVVPEPIPVPEIVPPEPEEFDSEPEVEHSILADEPGAATEPGFDTGPGTATGDGDGDGGTSDEGLFRITPPSPRGMIMPPSNRNLRGREVEVWVFVDAQGRVVADSTRLQPPTPDRDFNRRLIREAAQWVFEPARRSGIAIAAWFPYTISM